MEREEILQKHIGDSITDMQIKRWIKGAMQEYADQEIAEKDKQKSYIAELEEANKSLYKLSKKLIRLLKSAWISWQTSGDFGISREDAEAIFPEYCKEHNI